MSHEPNEGSVDDKPAPKGGHEEQPAEGAPQPDTPRSIPHRHPTGSPGLTGGWMAEGDEQDSGETQPSAEPETDPAAALPSLGDLPRRVPERDLSAPRVTPAA